MTIVLLKCPRCKFEFKREFKKRYLKGVKTTCPSCSKVFNIHPSLEKTRIIGER